MNTDTFIAEEENERLTATAKAADQLIEATPIDSLVDLAWQNLGNPYVVGRIYLHLRANDPSMALDFARYDFVAEKKFDRNGCIYYFEGDEVRDALLHESPRMHPWLAVQGRAVDSPFLVAYLARTLTDAAPKTLKAHLGMLARVAVPSLEAALIGLIPKPLVKDTTDDRDLLYALKDVCPALARIRSVAAVPHLIAHTDRIKVLSQSKNSEIAARMRDFLYEVAQVLIDTCRDIGSPECVDFIKTWLGSPAEDAAMRALIEMGDRDIVAHIEANIDAFSGPTVENPWPKVLKTIWPRVLLAYAKSRAGMSTEMDSSKLALRMQMHKEGDSEALHKMALFVLAKNGQPAEVRDLMLPFIDYPSPSVRAIVMDALRSCGENPELTFMDMARVIHLHETQGRDALIPYLESDFVVYQSNILRKLGEEGDACVGLEDVLIRVTNKLTRFDFYSGRLREKTLRSGDDAIRALAQMQNKKLDDYLHNMMGHHNVIYRDNALFLHKNGNYSPYLAERMAQPPNVRRLVLPDAC